MLNLVAGIQRPTKGRIYVHGRELHGTPEGVGYVTQQDTLLPWRTARKNIELPLVIRRIGKAERGRMVSELLELTGLAKFGSHYPAELSGGMKQRIALARSLVYDPSTLLMDEPFGALDALTRIELQIEFLRLWEVKRPTVIFVTHDLAEAVALADEVIVMSPSPGRISAHIEVDLPRPRDLNVIQADPRFGDYFRATAEALGAEGAQVSSGPRAPSNSN